MFPSATRALLVAALLLGVPQSLFGASDQRKRNLLLITLDTVRADYLGCSGSEHVQTPNLDRLAHGGVYFTRTRSPVPLTLPSHASILTGSYPPEHGVRDNGSYRLTEEQLALAEVLKERGYETAAFIGAFVLDRRFGLAQGFDVYDDRTWSDISMLENLKAERNADAVFGSFSEWLQDYRADRPFFAWVHLYDPHAPYTPPEPYRSRYPKDLYAGEVAYTDAVVGKIIDALASRKLIAHSVVAVVGDHGEGLGEHDEQTHSLLIYNSTLHVPMILYGPGLIPEGRRVDTLTRIIDLAPTLLDYLGVPGPFGQGRSLRARVEEKGPSEDVVSYSESLYPNLHLGWSALRGLETDRYRFILAPRPELYDLQEDGGEKVNRIDAQPDIAKELQEKLEALTQSMSSPAATRPFDAETETMLRSLGYVTGGAEGSGTVDPKDEMEIWNRIQLAIFQFGQGDCSVALQTLDKVRASDGSIPMIYQYMGSCYMELKRYADARRIYQEALAKGMESVDFHVNLGIIHHEAQDLSEAKRELEKALTLDEHSVPAHYRLANVYRAQGELAQALEHYRKAIDINPSYVYALNGLGMTLARMGRDEEALDAFRRTVGVDPVSPPGYLNLAIQLEHMERNQEALENYRKFMSLATDEEFPRERRLAAAAIRRLR